MAVKMPLSLKMSATWELEKSSSSVVPRVLHLCLSRLVVIHAPDPDLTTLMIAIRMRETSRRILRSPELALPVPPGSTSVLNSSGGGSMLAGSGTGMSNTNFEQLTVDLDLHFSVQYAHMLKRDTNILQILVQRRKKYKNKPMLGYKTLALCNINMAQVLQRCVTDRVIDLVLASPTKPNAVSSSLFGHLHVDSLASLPLEIDPSVARKKLTHGAGSSVVASSGLPACGASGGHGGLQSGAGESTELVFSDLFSEDEDSEDFESCGPPGAIDHRGRQQKKFLRAMSTGQRHLKQKLVGFIKRFRVNEDEVLGVAEQEDLNRIWEEIEELETNSDGDSDVDFDTLSLQSTPRPNLRPFFHDSMASVSGKAVPTVSVNHGGLLPDDTATNMMTSSFDRIFRLNLMSSCSDSSEEHSADGSTRVTEQSRSKVQKRDSSGLSRKGRSSERHSWRDKKSSNTKDTSSSQPGAGVSISAPPAPQTSALTVEQSAPVDLLDSRRDASPEPVRLVQYTQLPNAEPNLDTTEQVARLIDAKDAVPDCLVLLSRMEPSSKLVHDHLVQEGFKVIPVHTFSDTRHAMTRLVLKLQKQGRISLKVQIVLCGGGDAHTSTVLRVFVEHLSSRPHDWHSHFRFFPVPLPASVTGNTTTHQLTRNLCHLDSRYSTLFADCGSDSIPNLVTKLRTYLSQAQSSLHLPIGECLMSKGTEDENSEHFVPFLLGIRIGPAELLNNLDTDIPLTATSPVDGPPPIVERISPPGSPFLHSGSGKDDVTPPAAALQPPTTSLSSPSSSEPLELQIEYWTDGTERKTSMKSSFRGLLVNLIGGASCAGAETGASSALLSLTTLSKEKKQKLQIRLPGGRRAKDSDLRRESNDRISRLICKSARCQSNLMRVFVDGDSWSGVKFFQLTPSWQTHVKWFPIATFATTNISI